MQSSTLFVFSRHGGVISSQGRSLSPGSLLSLLYSRFQIVIQELDIFATPENFAANAGFALIQGHALGHLHQLFGHLIGTKAVDGFCRLWPRLLWPGKVKRRAFAIFRLNSNTAAFYLNELLDDRKPNARAVCIGRL